MMGTCTINEGNDYSQKIYVFFFERVAVDGRKNEKNVR